MKTIFFQIKAFALKIINLAENSPLNFNLWLFSLISLIITRVLIENWLGGFAGESFLFFFYHIAYNLIFFSLTYFIFVELIQKIIHTDYRKSASLMLWGYFIILLPPLIDYWISNGQGFLSFYGFYPPREIFWRFFSFFGNRPDFGITYGVRAEIALACIFLFFYGILKTGKWMRAFFLSFSAYTILFILASFPSWLTMLWLSPTQGLGQIKETDIATIFLTPAKIFSQSKGTLLNALSVKMSLIYIPILTVGIFFWLKKNYREKTLAFLQNARFPQLIYHGGLVIVGAATGIIFTKPLWDWNLFNGLAMLILLEVSALAWLASVIVNDIADEKIDAISNAWRPLNKKVFTYEEYKKIGVIIFLLSIFLAALLSFKISGLIIAYQALAWLYSSWPLRLKRFPFLASFLSALASLLIFFSGFLLVSEQENIHNLPVRLIWLLVFSYTFSLPLKDFKDVKGDRAEKVYTFPVLFGWRWGKIIVGSGVLLSFLSSVWFFKENSLFLWALSLGSLAFWLIIKMEKEKRFLNPLTLPYFILAIIFLYLARIVFLFFNV